VYYLTHFPSRHPGLDPGYRFPSLDAPERSGTPDQVRGDGKRD
jgi:hypothetical protein